MQQKFANSGMVLDIEIAKYIIIVAANIPHYIQMMAAEIWQYMVNSQTTVTKEIVDKSVKRLLALKNDYYMELFDRQSQSKKQLLQALTVNGKNIFSMAYITENRLPSAATLQRAVKDLIRNGTVEKMNDEYFIADLFFKLFVATT